MTVLLATATPVEFFATHVEARQARHDPSPPAPATDWRTLEQVLADDARLLRDTHAGLVGAGEPSKAAANYLAGWLGGGLGETVGFVLATAGAGVLVDERTRWRLHPGGWPDRVDVSGCTLVVPAGHPWAGQPGVEVVPGHGDVHRRTAEALAAFLTPFVEACGGLAKVGSASLWAQVADGVGGATAATPELAALGPTIPALDALLAVPGVPWRRRPTLWCATSEHGPVVVAQRGGCCLAYTSASAEPVEPPYCSTCRFREPDDVEARSVLWSDLLAASRHVEAIVTASVTAARSRSASAPRG